MISNFGKNSSYENEIAAFQNKRNAAFFTYHY